MGEKGYLKLRLVSIGPDNFGVRICSARYVQPESTKEQIEFMEGILYRNFSPVSIP